MPKSIGSVWSGGVEVSDATLQVIHSRRLFICLLLVHLGIILPIYDQIHLLFYLISLFVLSWRAGSLWRGWKLPGKPMMVILSLSGAAALVLLARQLGLLATMINLLMFSYALKFIELRGMRDIYTLILIGFFLVGVSFIFQQSIGVAIYLLMITLLSFYCLYLCHLPIALHSGSVTPMLRPLLAALPLAMILFLIIPRLGPLWKMPDARKASTGLSESLSPGDIAELGRSSKLAFRVSFDGRAVDRSQLYWRAMTHEHFDGRSWRFSSRFKAWQEDAERGRAKPVYWPVNGPQISYTVVAEANYQHWLYVLGNGASSEPSVLNAPGNTLYSRRLLTNTKQYHVVSVLEGEQSEQLNEIERNRNLQLPLSGNPQARALAQQLKGSEGGAVAISDAILRLFRQQDYFYTLKPPLLLTENSIDQFLFSSRAGFCEHYASAYTFLMRSAGVPARIVTGYLGGEYNPGADYYSIYQFDAHAWAEIWIDGEGWRRVDPTAAVAPERVLGSLEDALAEPNEFVAGDPFSLVRYRNIGWLTEMRHLMALVDYRWTVWVLNYSNERQLALLHTLFGQLSHWKMVFIALVGMGLGGCMLWLFGRINWREPQSPLARFRRKVEHRLFAQGIARQKGESFSGFLFRASEQLQQPSYQEIASAYQTLRYGAINQQQQQLLWRRIQQTWRKL
jgi:transglutaminase-like putative cysteine protease